ncbi:MAG: hypothetical protein WCJ76_15290 [Comamonadaceae bacterium]
MAMDMDIANDQLTRPALPLFDLHVKRAADLPTMTRYRWLNGPLPRAFKWLLHNPDAARALAHEAERMAVVEQEAA